MNKTMSKQPSVYISVNKNRKKVYNHNGQSVILMEDNMEFELEFFNPLTTNILAKIEMNGAKLSDGLIIKPGQRVYLERYLDKSVKFKFDTYEVQGSSDALAAIQNNGFVSVSFHHEKVRSASAYTTYVSTDAVAPPFYPGDYFNKSCGTDSTDYSISTFASLNTLGFMDMDLSSNISAVDSTATDATTYDVTSSIDCCASASDSLKHAPRKRSMKKKVTLDEIKTGRIEEGSSSNQDLQYSNQEFDYWPFTSTTYRMLPNSQKNIISIEDIRRYCPNCSKRVRNQKDKFCTNCGTKL